MSEPKQEVAEARISAVIPDGTQIAVVDAYQFKNRGEG